MGLSAGPLERYDSGQWLTTVQGHAQEAGLSASVVYADGKSPWLTPERATTAVRAFAQGLSARWGERFAAFAAPPRWNEEAGYQCDFAIANGVSIAVEQ